ncbi:MAG: metalloregulator ArsR/SmtB family transcription factor [Kineosporiaceae bacterium]
MVDAFSAAAEPTRRRLLHLLAGGSRTVTELAEEFPVTRSAISQHLGVLAEAGLVTACKDGRQRRYSLVPEGIAVLRAEIDRFWNTELALLADDAARRATPRSEEPS